MKLRVLYRKQGDPLPRHIQVTADATVTSGDVARALLKGPAADAAIDEAALPTLRVTDQAGGVTVLPPDQLVVSSGVVSGAVLEVVPAATHAGHQGDPVALLRVLGGPDTGVEVALYAGSSTVGRSSECAVRLTDPLVSKLHARIEIGETVEVVDANSANGVLVGGVRVPRVAVGPGDPFVLGATTLAISYTRRLDQTASASTDVEYIRSPRVLRRRRPAAIDLPQPQKIQVAQQFPILAMLAPMMMGVGMYAVTQSLLSLIFVAFSPLMMFGSWADQRMETRRQQREADLAYDNRLAEIDHQLDGIHAEQRQRLRDAHPAVTECVDQIGRLGELVWSRRPEHPEFLQVRLGEGPVRPLVDYQNAEVTAAPRYTQPRTLLLNKYAWIADAPVIADLRSVGGVGIAGTSGVAEGVARAIVLQAVTLQSPSEMAVTCLTSTAGRQRWQWLEWLPHAASPQSPTGPLQLSSEGATGRLLLDRLEDVVASRSADQEAVTLPAVLVIVDAPLVDIGRLTRLAENGPAVGVHILWVAAEKRLIPAACRTYLDLGDGTAPIVGMVREEELVAPVRVEAADAETAARVSRRLAPVVDAGMPTVDESDVPRSVSVISLLGQEMAVDSEQILGRWRENGSLTDRSAPPKPRDRASDLLATVGHSGTDPFTLDLRTQGPHALVGGTTGSGKSEFLQAWVLGLAHRYSPDRLTFLFVDYKGGAAFARCTDLPHSVGMVTDLSDHLVRRALRSLRAEIRHREELLNNKGVKDLIDFELTGDPSCPPALVIVVDEFAALKSEVPEFYDGVVDVAQRGRSLGLHLIMATQRPAGVITDSLRANTNLRVALRMNDDADSTDVLGDAMAARFDPGIPGRAAARTGPGRITRFQGGYPGARTYATPPVPPIEVTQLDFGLGHPWKVATATQEGPQPEKDIIRVVSAIRQASQAGKVRTPRRPWLEPLADRYNLENMAQRTDTELVLGAMDDPDHQRQIVTHFRPEEHGSVLILGAGGSGKTTALRTLGVAAGITPRGGPVHVYGLDFGGGGLTMLEQLPYVGSIVGGDDEERVTRLVKHLLTTVDERAARYNALRASSLSEYRTLANRPQEPRILLLLDNFGTFRAEYDTSIVRMAVYEGFRRIAADGRAVGVHVAMTADRGPSVPTSVASAFLQRVILRQANEDGYADLNVPRDVLGPQSPPGRAMLQDMPEEMQIAILGEDPSPAAQSRLIEELATEIGPRLTVRPEPIRALPELVRADTLPPSLAGKPVLGVESQSLAPFPFDPSGPLLITGPRGSGRTNALRWFAESLRRWQPGIELYLLTPRRSALTTWRGWTRTATGAHDVDSLVRDVLLPRVQSDVEPGTPPRFAIIAEGVSDFANGDAEMSLSDALVEARRNGHLVLGEAEVSEVGSGYSTVMSELKQPRAGFILQPDQDDEGVYRTPLGRIKRTDFPPGRGLWVKGGKTWRVQLPFVE